MRMLAIIALALGLAAPAAAQTPAATDPFADVAAVLMSPRCVGCHTTTQFPRQGDDLHPHQQNVKRGPGDHGVAGQYCSSCHGDTNNAASGAPGVSEAWRMAPLKMGWEGLSATELCRHLKDPFSNGGRNGPDLVTHMATPFVVWAWSAGTAPNSRPRKPPPVAYDPFVKATQAWVKAGQPCPGDAGR